MQPVIVNEQTVLMPRPVYILPETVNISEDRKTVTGKCRFPMTDISVADRQDHANICHHLFTVWNVAGIGGMLHGWKNPRVIEGGFRADKITPPDTDVDFKVNLKSFHKLGDRIIFAARADFSLNGESLVNITIKEAVAEKA